MKKIIPILAVLATAGAIAFAASSANFTLDPVVIDQGGGDAYATNYIGAGSIGGSVIGASSSANYALEADFGYTLGDEPGGSGPPPFLVLLGSQNPGPTNEANAATGVPMLQVRLSAGAGGTTVSGITFTAFGSGNDGPSGSGGDVASVRLFLDADSDGLLDPVTDVQLGSTASFSGDDGTASFAGVGRTIPAGTAENWLVVCDFNVLGSALKTFGVAVASAADVSAAAAGTGSPIAVVGPPLTGSLKTMNPGMGAAGTLTIMLGPAHRPTGSVEPGRSASMMQIQLSASSLEGVVVQSLRFNGSGSGHEVDHVRGVSLCDDADGDGSPDPGAPLAGPVPFYWDDGTATFALSVAVNAGSSRTLVLVYDFVAPIAAEGVTFQASLLTTADVTARGVTSYISVSPSLRPATPLSGPLVSIRHPPATEPAYFMGGCAAGPGPAGAPGALGLLLLAAGLAASLRALRRARR